MTLFSLLWCTAVVPAAAQTVWLSWDPPATGPDVSYIVHYGTASGAHPSTVQVPRGVTSQQVSGLSPGTYYFVVRALDPLGRSSGFSPELRVEVTAPAPPPPPAPEPVPSPAPTAPEPTAPEPTAPATGPIVDVGGGSLDSGPIPAPAEPTPPAPGGASVIRVSTATELLSAVRGIGRGRTVLLEPGTYALPEPLVISDTADLQIRGRSGRASDVTILAPGGWAGPAISVSRVTGLTLADVTVAGGAQLPFLLGDGVHRPRLERLRVIGQGVFLLSVAHLAGGGAVDGAVIDCRFEARRLPGTLPVGLDLRAVRHWTLRGNAFTYAASPRGPVPGAVILAWQGSVGTIVERNVFVNAGREIVLGLSPGRPDQHTGGVVRNNMIVRRAGTGARGPAISILDTPRALVAHNSVLVAGTSPVAVEYAHPDTRRVFIVNNLLDAAVAMRDGAVASLVTNVTIAEPGMFVSPAAGNLHLRPEKAAVALGRGTGGTWAPLDVDGEARRTTTAPDVGADQVVR